MIDSPIMNATTGFELRAGTLSSKSLASIVADSAAVVDVTVADMVDRTEVTRLEGNDAVMGSEGVVVSMRS